MKRRSLVVFAGDPSEDSGLVLLDLCFCFGPSGSADIVVLHEGECHGLPESVAPSVVVASVW